MMFSRTSRRGSALGVVVIDHAVGNVQSSRGAVPHTVAAVDAVLDGFGIVAVLTVEVAPLQEHGGTVARPVHAAEGNDFIDYALDHLILR